MQVVLDANIYISSLISEKGNPFQIIKMWRNGEFDIVVSRPIVDEILRVSGYERIQKKYPKVKENRLELVDLIADEGIWAVPSNELDVVTADPSDNRYIECAVAGSAQYIVTGDNHLLDLGAYKGIYIITPATFLTLLDTPNHASDNL